MSRRDAVRPMSGWYRGLWGLVVLVVLAPWRASSAPVVPAPIVVAPSQYWEGNDGPWSTFTVQVGTPAQNVRALISTAGTATWVVVPEGCPASGPANCNVLRGELFNRNASSTWKFNDFFELALESNLGLTGNGAYGFDAVGVGWQGSGGPKVEHQVVAGLATNDFWLGTFGLTPRPTNFTDFNDPQPSFMETMKNKSLIPSLSWGYTAGASYRLQKVLGSLVLGGYDASKTGPSNMTFDFGQDISRDLTVGLQAITLATQGKSVPLLPKGIFTFIDSTVPHIWLPLEACVEFEKALGLTWNAAAQLYLVNDTLHASLLASNATFDFKIGNTTDGGASMHITLPYASFDLVADYPRVANETRYFPIARAANDTQYTLGRTFLQEAHLTVDYERSKFYLSQASFEAGVPEHIVAIPPLNATIIETTAPPSSSPSAPAPALSAGAIAGIAVGAAILVAILVILLLLRRRRAKKSDQLSQGTGYPLSPIGGGADVFEKAELDANDTASPGHEMPGTAVEYFQPDKPELHDTSPLSPSSLARASAASPETVYHEMAGESVPATELPAPVERPNEAA